MVTKMLTIVTEAPVSDEEEPLRVGRARSPEAVEL